MSTITVQTPSIEESKYQIIIESGVCDRIGKLLRELVPATRIMIITDSNVEKLYLNKTKKSLESAGFVVSYYVFAAGEQQKTLSTVGEILEALSEAQLSRSDAVVALGGGVCGDLAGFAAGIYQRGIDYVMVPTSLLSQIDSSVGGKTACDLKSGKNLAGVFKNPILVAIDPLLLNTLPKKYFADGLGEAIKYGAIKSSKLLERLITTPAEAFLLELIEECVKIKVSIVTNDFLELGDRMILNFGHTIGHAIENYYGYGTIPHGEAVGIGMVMITAAAEKHGICKPGSNDKIIKSLEMCGLRTHIDADLKTLCDLSSSDKKRRGNNLNVVLISEIGQPLIHTIPASELYDFLK